MIPYLYIQASHSQCLLYHTHSPLNDRKTVNLFNLKERTVSSILDEPLLLLFYHSKEQFCNANALQYTNGYPQKSFIFLRGIDLLPPRTGINAITILFDFSLIYYAEQTLYLKYLVAYKSML